MYKVVDAKKEYVQDVCSSESKNTEIDEIIADKMGYIDYGKDWMTSATHHLESEIVDYKNCIRKYWNVLDFNVLAAIVCNYYAVYGQRYKFIPICLLVVNALVSIQTAYKLWEKDDLSKRYTYQLQNRKERIEKYNCLIEHPEVLPDIDNYYLTVPHIDKLNLEDLGIPNKTK